jgi:hypothetical protein
MQGATIGLGVVTALALGSLVGAHEPPTVLVLVEADTPRRHRHPPCRRPRVRPRRKPSETAHRQGLTLAHFRAQLEDLRDTSLKLELNLSTFGTHSRVGMVYMGVKVSLG